MPSHSPVSAPVSGSAPGIEQVFAPGGLLARALPQFRPREGQQVMAQAVAQAIARRERLVVEAGTGVGKTFAYLVPALLSGEKVWISTATKALQDQLYAHDLPLLLRALALPLRTAVLKGRSSYLCRYRLERARQDGVPSAPAILHELAQIERWAQATHTGDLAELPELGEDAGLVPFVTSTRENCLGPACPRFHGCHVFDARKRALAADVVVLNHHLFFADLTVREAGTAELLPASAVVVFDEAHRLADTALQFLGTRLALGQLLFFCDDLVAVGQRWAGGWANWPALGELLRAAVDRWRGVVTQGRGRSREALPPSRLGWARFGPEGVPSQDWNEALEAVVGALRQALRALDGASHEAQELARLHERAVRLLEALAAFSGEGARDTVRWLELGAEFALAEFPLDVASALRDLWCGPGDEPGAWDEGDPAAAPGGGRAWIFTSATLGDDAGLSWFTQACGLEGARTLRIDAPFDYTCQAALYVPMHLPSPEDPSHSERLADWLAPAVRRLGGRTLVLTTSLRALEVIARVLRSHFSVGGGVEVLAQGQAPKRQLLARFRGPRPAGQAGCVLVGAASFWEGVDIPGEALQLVVIDKLPFPAPGDPWVEARIEQLELQGRSAFRDHALPAAALALKQGAGRLVRHENDAGVLVVADARLRTRGYGKRLMRALPPMAILESEETFGAALDSLRQGQGISSVFGL